MILTRGQQLQISIAIFPHSTKEKSLEPQNITQVINVVIYF